MFFSKSEAISTFLIIFSLLLGIINKFKKFISYKMTVDVIEFKNLEKKRNVMFLRSSTVLLYKT